MMSNLLLMKPEFVFVLWICAGKYKRKPTRKCRKGSGLALPNRLRTLSVPPEVPEWPAGLLSVQKPLNKSAQNNRVHQKLPARLCRAPLYNYKTRLTGQKQSGSVYVRGQLFCQARGVQSIFVDPFIPQKRFRGQYYVFSYRYHTSCSNLFAIVEVRRQRKQRGSETVVINTHDTKLALEYIQRHMLLYRIWIS